jgi:hypothetical protein
MDKAVTAGIGKPTKVTPSQPFFPPQCVANNCEAKAGDGKCDVSVFYSENRNF